MRLDVPWWRTTALEGGGPARGQPQGGPGPAPQPACPGRGWPAAEAPRCPQSRPVSSASPLQALASPTQVAVTCAISGTCQPLQPCLLHDGQTMGTTAGASAATLDHETPWEQKLCWAKQQESRGLGPSHSKPVQACLSPDFLVKPRFLHFSITHS